MTKFGRNLLAFILVVFLLFVVMYLVGCASLDVRFHVERVSQGARTSPGEKVEKPEFISGQTTILGQGVWESGGVGGTLRGYEQHNDGRVRPVNRRVP